MGDLRPLLRAHRERPRRRSSEKRDELAPFHPLAICAGSRKSLAFRSGHQNRKLLPAK
jgi:hypothetical protein